MSHILVNVAWPYANGPRHIGHVAGFGVPSDVYARYERMKGNDVLMVSGTDEHGTPILVEADKEGVSAQELANRYNRVIAKDLCDLGLSYDLFTRTTTGNHEQVVQELFKQCLANGYIYKGTQKVAISPSTGRTLPDRYIEGTCPICGADGARGDQCDACGNELDPDELINPVSKINGETPRFEETEHFFLDLPALAEANLAWLKTREGWRTNVINFSIGLFKEVKPRAITRDIDWGIPVPVAGWIDNPNKKLYAATCGHPSNGLAARAIRKHGAHGGMIRKPRATTSWAKTTSRSTPRSGRPKCSATTVRAPRAAKPASSVR